MARLRLVVQKSTVVDGGAPVLETRHFLQAVAGVDCDTDAAAFLALDNKQALTTTDVPVNLAGMHWNPRGCSPSGAVPTIIYDPAYPHVPDTPGGGTDPGSTNPSDETNSILYTSTSNNDGGPV
ncbi:hypothetical protein [Spirosoma endbachense]|uniref:Uncharacterized protein n=1 Tax=Spirosoma endbachense TaxID=2666025 RepID=A0A6P1W1B8_9BACT|nr:hypothetical protein [Spirosoma endbachense]QHV99231.1 hypothetical protein GJR95_31330 [Spirosoma endbachense]